MNPEIKKWFIEKIAQNPEYLERTYLPAIEKLEDKADFALDQALKFKGIEDIKYWTGWRDGVREIRALLGGLKIAEGRKPAEPGLMARILSLGT